MPIGFVVRVRNRDILVIGQTLKEAEDEYKRNKESIEKFTGLKVVKLPISPSSKPSVSELILQLKEEGFFDQPKKIREISEKLIEGNHHYPVTSLTLPLANLIRSRNLGRIKREGRWVYVRR